MDKFRPLFFASLALIILLITLSACAPVAAGQPPAGQTSSSVTEQASSTIDSIEEVLGTLIVFAAFMLILAVGTEAVIDAFKLAVGFKSKPTAMDAVNKLRDWLPGQLSEAGVSSGTAQSLTHTLDAMASTISDADQASRAVSAANSWLTEASRNLAAGDVSGFLSRDLPGLEKAMKDAGVKTEYIATAKSWLKGSLATLQATTVKGLVESLDVLLEKMQIAPERKKKLLPLIQNWLVERLPDLTSINLQQVSSASKLLEHEIPALENQLQGLGLREPEIKELMNWLRGIAASLDAASSNAFSLAMTSVLQTVENRRELIQSPLRKLWRWLKKTIQAQHAAHPNNKLWGWLHARLGKGRLRLKPDRVILPLNPVNIAHTLFERDDAHRDEELSRLRWLRVVSILVGLWLAMVLQIDVGRLLEPIVTADLVNVLTRRLAVPLSPMEAWNLWGGFWWINWQWNQLLSQLSIGILISGLAASAGATFWHDVLDRLQAAKKTTSAVSDMVEQLRQLETGK